MLFPNLILAHLAKQYLVVQETDPAMIPSLTGNFTHSAKRLGREAGSVSVSIDPILNITNIGAPVVYNLFQQQLVNGNISYSLNPNIQFGDQIKYVLKTDYGLWIKRDTITKT